ncbi:MAG TPA: GlmU family protein [Candidatus Kapabacteria bacterium]|nr:GlmU family protein [Candidatus Kapabacteria bacterium]
MAQSFENVLIYEDAPARSRKFLPLTYTRSVAELRSGAFTAIERIQALFREAKVYLHARPELKDVITRRYGLGVNEVPAGSTLLLNAREALAFNPNNHWHVYEELPSEISERLIAGEAIEPPEAVREDAPASLWEMVHANAGAIMLDAELWPMINRSIERPSFANCAVIKPDNLLVHPDARVDSGVVLDCSEGEIIIEEGVHIMPNVAIIGPAFIGRNSIVKISAKIYEGTSVGPVSKVGGEIENSIIQGYSNKQHDGYLGHSFLGEWVNLGAGTNTSDLKNDYSPVRVTIEGEEFETNSLFVGLMMGDHSKCAIGTQFNTGTMVGVNCNIFGEGFPPKWIPSFSWGGAKGMTTYRFEKALDVARAVMQRRNVSMSAEEAEMYRSIFDGKSE